MCLLHITKWFPVSLLTCSKGTKSSVDHNCPQYFSPLSTPPHKDVTHSSISLKGPMLKITSCFSCFLTFIKTLIHSANVSKVLGKLTNYVSQQGHIIEALPTKSVFILVQKNLQYWILGAGRGPLKVFLLMYIIQLTLRSPDWMAYSRSPWFIINYKLETRISPFSFVSMFPELLLTSMVLKWALFFFHLFLSQI